MSQGGETAAGVPENDVIIRSVAAVFDLPSQTGQRLARVGGIEDRPGQSGRFGLQLYQNFAAWDGTDSC